MVLLKRTACRANRRRLAAASAGAASIVQLTQPLRTALCIQITRRTEAPSTKTRRPGIKRENNWIDTRSTLNYVTLNKHFSSTSNNNLLFLYLDHM